MIDFAIRKTKIRLNSGVVSGFGFQVSGCEDHVGKDYKSQKSKVKRKKEETLILSFPDSLDPGIEFFRLHYNFLGRILE